MPSTRPLAAAFTAFALLAAAAAHSQVVSLYGTFTPVHVSNVASGINTSTGTSSYWNSGVGGGVTFGVLPIGPIHIGLDLRGSSKPGTNGADTALGGLRVGLKLPFTRLKPYAQASGGYLATRTAITTGPTAGGTLRTQYAAYEILGGVDYKLIPFLDLRLIEAGGGKGYTAFDSANTPSRTVSLFTLSTGVVFHF